MSNPNQQPLPVDPELQARQEAAYATVTNLVEEGKTLDGPTLNGAGLNYEERISLNYPGSIDQFLEDASTWKAEQDEQARREAFHAANTAKADAWRQEKDAIREQRDAANSRIDNLMDGSAAVEGLSYKEKLENGGELGLKFKVAHSTMDRDSAVAQAASEGHDVSHTEPRYVQVPRNEAAEGRASEMAALLREQTYRAPRDEELPVEGPAEEREPVVEPIVVDAHEQEGAPEATEEREAGLEIIEDNADSLGRDRGGRMRRTREGVQKMLGTVGAKARALKDTAIQKGLETSGYIADKIAGKESNLIVTKESYRRRQTAVWGAAAGVIAVYAASRFGLETGLDLVSGSSGNGGGNVDPTSGKDLPQSLGSNGSGSTGSGNGAELGNGSNGNGQGAETVADNVRLHDGDTAWGAAEKALGNGASVEDIDRVKDAILQQNNLTETQASQLPVGTKLTMPVELIEQLRKDNE